MFNNKKDPLVDAVKKIMEQNEKEREALKIVNEAFGVHSKKALPHELHGKYDAMLEEAKKCMYEEDDDKKQKLTKKQIENIASEAGDPEEIEKEDFEKLRKRKREKLEEKAPPGKKYERMVKHIKKTYAKKGGLTKKEEGIAYATAWKNENKKMDESFDALNEEIRNNLLEKLNSVYETYGEQAAQYAYDTLSEEERGILGERTGTAKFYTKGPQPTPTPTPPSNGNTWQRTTAAGRPIINPTFNNLGSPNLPANGVSFDPSKAKLNPALTPPTRKSGTDSPFGDDSPLTSAEIAAKSPKPQTSALKTGTDIGLNSALQQRTGPAKTPSPVTGQQRASLNAPSKVGPNLPGAGSTSDVGGGFGDEKPLSAKAQTAKFDSPVKYGSSALPSASTSTAAPAGGGSTSTAAPAGGGSTSTAAPAGGGSTSTSTAAEPAARRTSTPTPRPAPTSDWKSKVFDSSNFGGA